MVGLDIGATHFRTGIYASLRGKPCFRVNTSRWAHWGSYAKDVEQLKMQIRSLLGTHPQRWEPQRVGVALAANMDAQGIVKRWANRPHWQGRALRQEMEDLFGTSVVFEDDANAAALAEHRFGAARLFANVLVVTVGTGVGSGIILENKLFKGPRGWAGELGHTGMIQAQCPTQAPPTILQDICGGRALDAAAVQAGLKSSRDVLLAASGGNSWAIDVLKNQARHLGWSVANALNLLDLDGVVIGGRFTRSGQFWQDEFRSAIQQGALRAIKHEEIKLARYGYCGGVLGALVAAGASEPASVVQSLHLQG